MMNMINLQILLKYYQDKFDSHENEYYERDYLDDVANIECLMDDNFDLQFKIRKHELYLINEQLDESIKSIKI